MTQRKPVLGRGLSALLPGKDDVPRGTPDGEVEIERLTPSRFQPRRDFSPASLADLAQTAPPKGQIARFLHNHKDDGARTTRTMPRRVVM